MRVSSFLGRNASYCDFKQLFPRLAGVALLGGTRELNTFGSISWFCGLSYALGLKGRDALITGGKVCFQWRGNISCLLPGEFGLDLRLDQLLAKCIMARQSLRNRHLPGPRHQIRACI